MQPNLTLERFGELAAAYAVVPVAIEVLADRETPVSVFEQLVGDDDGFLLESVEGGERWARWSFVGRDPEFTLTAVDGRSSVDVPQVEVPDGDPLSVLEAMLDRYRTPPPAELGLTPADIDLQVLTHTHIDH